MKRQLKLIAYYWSTGMDTIDIATRMGATENEVYNNLDRARSPLSAAEAGRCEILVLEKK